MEGFLKLAVLKHLSRRPLAGYGLMQAIAEETGWKPSPGSMYPLLNSMVKDELATVKTQGRKRVYTITKGGADALEELLGQNRSRFERVASQLRVCSPNHPADKDTTSILERLSKGEAPFGWLSHDMLELRKLMLHVGNEQISEAEKRAIRKALMQLLTVLKRAA